MGQNKNRISLLLDNFSLKDMLNPTISQLYWIEFLRVKNSGLKTHCSQQIQRRTMQVSYLRMDM